MSYISVRPAQTYTTHKGITIGAYINPRATSADIYIRTLRATSADIYIQTLRATSADIYIQTLRATSAGTTCDKRKQANSNVMVCAYPIQWSLLLQIMRV